MTSTPTAPTRYAADLDAEHRAAVLDLVDATHRLNLAVATTDLDEATLRRADRARRPRNRARRAPPGPGGAVGFEAPGVARAGRTCRTGSAR